MHVGFEIEVTDDLEQLGARLGRLVGAQLRRHGQDLGAGRIVVDAGLRVVAFAIVDAAVGGQDRREADALQRADAGPVAARNSAATASLSGLQWTSTASPSWSFSFTQ